jgi:hypothetical protein
MYYRDHDPPHFHAVYGEYQAQIVIETLEPLLGSFRRERSGSSGSGRRSIVQSSRRTGRRPVRGCPSIRLRRCHEHKDGPHPLGPTARRIRRATRSTMAPSGRSISTASSGVRCSNRFARIPSCSPKCMSTRSWGRSCGQTGPTWTQTSSTATSTQLRRPLPAPYRPRIAKAER